MATGFVTDSDDEDYSWVLIEEKRDRQADDEDAGSSEKRQRGLDNTQAMNVIPQGPALAIERMRDLQAPLVDAGYVLFKTGGLIPNELDDVSSEYAATYNEYIRLRRLVIGDRLYEKLGQESDDQAYYQSFAKYRLGLVAKRPSVRQDVEHEQLVYFLGKEFEKVTDTDLYDDELRRLRDLLSFDTSKNGQSFNEYFTEIDNYYKGEVFDLNALVETLRGGIETPVDNDSPAQVKWYFKRYERFIRIYEYIFRRFVTQGPRRYTKVFTKFSDEQIYIITQTFIKSFLRPTQTIRQALPGNRASFLITNQTGQTARRVLLRFFQAFGIQLKGLDLESAAVRTENTYKTAKRLAKLLVTIPAIESPYVRFAVLTEELETTQQAREFYTKGFLPARTEKENRLFLLAADQNPQQDQADLLYAVEYLDLVYQLIPPGFDFDPLALLPRQREALAAFLFRGEQPALLAQPLNQPTTSDSERQEQRDKAEAFRSRFPSFLTRESYIYTTAVENLTYGQRVAQLWQFQTFEQFADILDQYTDLYGQEMHQIVRGRVLPNRISAITRFDNRRFYLVAEQFLYLTGKELVALGLLFHTVREIISAPDFAAIETIYNQMVRKRIYNEDPINLWQLPQSIQPYKEIVNLFNKLAETIAPGNSIRAMIIGVQIPQVFESIVEQNGQKILMYVATLKQQADSKEERADLTYLAKMLGIDLETNQASPDRVHPSYALEIPVFGANADKAYQNNRAHLLERINAFMDKPVKDFVAKSIEVGASLEKKDLQRVRNINRKLFYGLLFETSTVSDALSDAVLGIESLEQDYSAVYERFSQ